MAHISDSILWLSLSRYRRLVVGSMIAYERGMSDAILSLAILASAALIWGGVRLIRDAKEVRKGRLMIIAALVLFANVLIVAWPQ